jgi:hypothetical protein
MIRRYILLYGANKRKKMPTGEQAVRDSGAKALAPIEFTLVRPGLHEKNRCLKQLQTPYWKTFWAMPQSGTS